jgi:carbon-monoxide dehydrogenase medium subunit
MIPGSFAYYRPTTVPETLALLAEHGDEAKVLAGGQSLIPFMRFRLASPAVLVDINHLAALQGLREEDGGLVIGALTREVELERSPLVRARYPLLAAAAAVIADPLVRNLATVGGNLAHADPANDHPAAMLALRARLHVVGPSGERVIPIDDFFVDAFTTALAPGELLTAIHIPGPPPRSGGAYVKFERKVGDYAIAAAAAQLTLNEDGTIAQAGLSVTNVAPRPFRAAAAEAALLGQPLTDAVIRAAAELVAAAAEPESDLRGSADYKRAMTRTVTIRALRQAAAQASGGAALAGAA